MAEMDILRIGIGAATLVAAIVGPTACVLQSRYYAKRREQFWQEHEEKMRRIRSGEASNQ